MTTSQQTSFLSEISSGAVIPEMKRAYFRERLRNNLYDFVVGKFLDQHEKHGLTKKKLGQRVGHSAEVITRWLGAPGNWTLDTISDLLLGIAGEELTPSSSSLINRTPRNFTEPDWFSPAASGNTSSGSQILVITADQKPPAAMKTDNQSATIVMRQ